VSCAPHRSSGYVEWWMRRRTEIAPDRLDRTPVLVAMCLHNPARMSTLFTNTLRRSAVRRFHTRAALRYPAGLENILGGGPTPPVQVRSIGEDGIQLADGLVIPSACIFMDGQVFLWNVPAKPWKDWTKEHFRIFDVVVPKPGA